MTGKIQLVNWDADRVMYNGLSTSICAEKSPLDPQPYLEEFINEKEWFTYDDVLRWVEYKGKGANNPIQTVGDLAECLTDFLYSMKKPGTDDSIITKPQTKEGKQMLLKGLSLDQVREISEGIEYTPGFLDAVKAFEDDKLIQIILSDGLGPHIEYQADKLDFNYGAGVQPVVEYDGKELYYGKALNIPGSAKLTGKIEEFDKNEYFDTFLILAKMHRKNVAVIDDSGANVEKLHKPVRDAGGVAVGFNVTDAHKPKFEENSIPIIKGDNIEPFIEIVRDPREATISMYCE